MTPVKSSITQAVLAENQCALKLDRSAPSLPNRVYSSSVFLTCPEQLASLNGHPWKDSQLKKLLPTWAKLLLRIFSGPFMFSFSLLLTKFILCTAGCWFPRAQLSPLLPGGTSWCGQMRLCASQTKVTYVRIGKLFSTHLAPNHPISATSTKHHNVMHTKTQNKGSMTYQQKFKVDTHMQTNCSF